MLRLQLLATVALCVALIFLLDSYSAHAQTIIDWTGGGADDDYDDTLNWSGGNVPNNTNESARFNIPGTFDVDLPGLSNRTVSDLLVLDGDVTFASGANVFIHNYTVDDDATIGSNFSLKNDMGGQVRLVVDNDLTVTSDGLFTVDDSTRVDVGNLFVGRSSGGDGEVIFDDSTLDVNNSVILGGAGSTGELTFRNDSTSNEANTVSLAVGSTAGSTGLLTVSGGSTLTTGNMNVGSLSTSASAVQEAKVAVAGTDSRITQTGASTLRIGDADNPNIDALVELRSRAAFNTGTGETLIQNSGRLDVGTITASAEFNANGPLRLDSGGTIALAGVSRVNANAGLDMSGGGDLLFNGGTLTVTNGSFVPEPGLALGIGFNATIGTTSRLNLGAGATGSLNGIVLGGIGTGEFFVRDGAVISVSGLNIGLGATGRAGVVGSGSQLTVGGTLMSVGNGGEGTFSVSDGATASTPKTLIGAPLGFTRALVSGANSVWTVNGDVTTGSAGNGTLNVFNSGTLTIASGEMFVESSGSVDVDNGTLNSTGNLTMAGGGIAIGGGGTMSGNDAFLNSSASVLVTGTGSSWNNTGTVLVGLDSGGLLDVLSGGTVTSNFGVIGENEFATGVATINGTDSSWQVTNDVIAGNFGQGTLRITAGGAVSSGRGFIAASTGSTGNMNVMDADSSLSIAGDLYVGGNDVEAGGTGTLTQDDGLVDVDGTVEVWDAGTFNLQGGALEAQTIDHTHGGSFNFTGGTLRIDTFQGDLTNQGGSLGVGDEEFEVGVANITGDYDQQAGSLDIEIATQSFFDNLEVTGTATLGGTLNVNFVNGIAPSLGDTFEILTAGNVVNEFDTENLPDLGTLDWSVSYTATTVVLEIVEVTFDPADLNTDGFVDGLDLGILLGNWNTDVPASEGELNGTPPVDGLDLGILLGAWNPPPALAESQAVPEPNAVLLALLAISGFFQAAPRFRGAA